MAQTAVVDHLTVQEKLLLAQAVYKVGAVDWPVVSKLLVEHPCTVTRPHEYFTPEACEAAYIALMTSIELNVPAPDGFKPQAKVHLQLARTFYFARMQELKDQISTYERRFTDLMGEISAIKAGKLDEKINTEIRNALAKKYGRRVIDTWVPPSEQVKEAVVAGPESAKTPEAGEKTDAEMAEDINDVAKEEDEEKGKVDEEKEKVEVTEEHPEKADEPEASPEDDVDNTPETEIMDEKEELTPSLSEHENQEEEQIATLKPSTPILKLSTPTPKPSSPPSTHHAELSPASELSPLPADDSTTAEDLPESPTPISTRGQKRKASMQPRGVPVSKRSARRAASPVPTPDESEADDEVEETKEEIEVEEETGRGRRGARRSAVKKAVDSPLAKESSPPTSRRAGSASSTASGTPVGPDGGRTRRSGRASRGMRDDVVSKNMREHSEAASGFEEKDDEEIEVDAEAEAEAEAEIEPEPEEEKRNLRTSGRRKGTEPVSTPAEKRGKRGVAAVARAAHESVGDEDDADQSPVAGGGAAPAASASTSATRASVGAVASTSATTGPRSARQTSPREQKGNQKLILSLLDSISQHRYGPVFQNPVKKTEASDYYDIIKRPMDLKTIRSRIKDGSIATIDEFERDIRLMFANATVYNARGSQVYEMAREMLQSSSEHIAHYKSMQHHLNR